MQEYNRQMNLKAKYGITPEEYNELLVAQKEKCAICGGPKTRKYFDVDHDHETNKVRGLLCLKCNLLLGHANDDVTLLHSAVDYLERNKKE